MIAISQNPAHMLKMSAGHFGGVVPDAVSVILPVTDSSRKSAALPTDLLTSATAVQRDVILTNLVGDYRLELQKGLSTTNQGETCVREYVKGRNGRKQIEWGDFFLTL